MDHRGFAGSPLAVHVHVLIVEFLRGGLFHSATLIGSFLLDHRDDNRVGLQPLLASSSFGIGSKITVCQFVIDQHHQLLSGVTLMSIHSTNFGVVGSRGERCCLVLRCLKFRIWLYDENIGVASTGPVRILDAIFHEIAFN